jgi:hypothetical protein
MGYDFLKCSAAILLVATIGGGIPTAARATVYDAVTGFSKKENPSGPWSYFAGGTLMDHREAQDGDKEIHFWWNGQAMPDTALIGRNFGSKAWEGATVVIYPDHLDMDPENIADVTVRFTAPLSGSYAFKGNFKGTDKDEASHQVAIAVNGSTVFTGTISNFGELVTFKGRAHLHKGDTIDFISQTNGGEAFLSTGLKVTVSGH